MSRRIAIIATLLALASTGAAAAPVGDQRLPLPDGWQPEGIASGPGKALYVGSIPTGAVLRLNPRSGQTRPVVPAREGHAAIGLKADRDKLFVAGGPTGKAFAYDRRSGDELKAFALADAGAGPTFVNDVALAGRFAYFTDSRRAVIYRVRRDLSGATELRVPAITQETGNNLNGIVAHKRFLLAIQTNTGALWRIDRRSGDVRQVDLGGIALTNGDGLLLERRKLFVVQNRNNRIAVVKLSKDLGSGTVKRAITSSDFDVPTTIARQGKHLFAVNARFGTTDPQPAPYWVTKLR